MEQVNSLDNLWQKYPSSSLLLWLLLALFPLLCFMFIKHKNTKQKNLPPSPPKLPIIGNLHQLGRLLHKSLQELAHKHGPLMFVHFGSTRFLVVSSADAVEEITKHHDINFSNRYGPTAVRPFTESEMNIVLSPYGDNWREARKICALHLLSQNVVNRLQRLREEEISTMLETVRLSSLKGSEINLHNTLVSLSANVVYRSFTGHSTELKFNGMTYGDWHTKFNKLVGAICFEDLFPRLGWMDRLTGFTANQKKTFGELDGFVELLINACKDPNYDEKSFVDILLHLQEDGKLNYDLAFNDIKALIQSLFFAATENVPLMMEWIMAELAKHPDSMRKAQDEVRRIVGNKSKISNGDIDQMHYLKCVMKETLRLHPFGVFPRETLETVKIYGYEIPAKTKVMVNHWAIQRDPKVWENPDEFIPERFADKQIDYKGNQKGFVPFGFGRRYCPGISYALAVVENVIANLLCWYDWKVPGGSKPQDLDMSEDFVLSIVKKHPLRLVPLPPSMAKAEG